MTPHQKALREKAIRCGLVTPEQAGIVPPTVAALFVQRGGIYWDRPGVDAWDEERDARLYDGPHPVVAHPPCQLWVNLAAVNWVRYRKTRPAWYPGGDDGGCFASALANVRRCGGVLEHPADSWAWARHGLPEPDTMGWQRSLDGEWVCEVWQSAYGHVARKRTWLFYVGAAPAPLLWNQRRGTKQVGQPSVTQRAAGALPGVTKSEAIGTPRLFSEALLKLARNSRHRVDH